MPDTSKPSLYQAIRGPIDFALREAAVALPGIVKKFNGTTVDVQPAVHRSIPSIEDPDVFELEVMPVIPNVPILWVQAVGIKIRASLRVGDPVLLIAMDRDVSVWRKTGEASEPGDDGFHHWGNCVAIPGYIPNTDPFPEPSDSAALASVTLQDLNALRDKLEDLIHRFDTHVHATAAVGTPSIPVMLPATLPPWALPTVAPDSMIDPASGILKLDG